MKEIVVRTDRLCIMPQNGAEVRALYDQEENEEMKQVYDDIIRMMAQLPGQEEWGSEWKIMLGQARIGGIGFKGLPDDDGVVEIGYGIVEEYRRNGYATEALKGMVSWAFEQSGVNQVVAQTEESNDISAKVLMNNGLVRDGYGDEGPMYKIDNAFNLRQ